MSEKPSDFDGYPSASAMGLGIAITSGVSMNRVEGSVMGASPLSISRWLTTAPHALAAGDQITGCGPLASGSGHPAERSAAPAPDALLRGRTNTHVSPTFA